MANDQDVNKIKNDVEKIEEKFETVSKNGIKINGSSFNRLSSIINIETSLQQTADNTQHISESLSSGKGIYGLLEKIREEATRIKTAIGTNNPHINSTGGGTVSIQNASTNSQNLGGTSDIFNRTLSEIQDFHRDVVNILDLTNIISKNLEGSTAQEIAGKMEKVLEGKDIAETKFQERKYSDVEDARKRKRKEERYTRKVNRENGKTILGIGLNSANSLLKGVNTNDVANGISNALSKIPGIGGIATSGLFNLIKSAFDLYAKVDKEASDYARVVGGSRYQKHNIFNTSQRVAGNTRALYGINQEEIIKQAKEVAEAFGRNISHISDKAMESSLMLKKMGIDAQTLGNLDTYGLSIEQADQHFSDLYKRVSKHGVSFKNVSKAVSDNLKAAQSYSFANGLKGLEQMAERSTQLKFNVQQAMTFAEKVSTFEGAIQTGANLSVLGGTFAAYSNPIQMMYEALNDVEALQERMIKTYSGKAYWDSEKGQLRINPQDLRLIRAAADAMGVDKNEMVSMTMNQAKFSRIDSQINKSLFDDDTIEFIKNLAEIDKNGNANITLNGQTKAVSGLTAQDSKFINREMEQMEEKKNATMGDIYVNTMGIGEKLDNLLKYITTKLGTWVAKIAGVKYEDNASKAVWHSLSPEEKQNLIAKHGSRNAAKRAVGIGLESELIESYLAPDDSGWNAEYTREFLNKNAKHSIGRIKFRNDKFNDEITNFNTYKRLERKEGGIISGNYHVDGGTPAIYNGMPVEIEKDETLFGKDVLYRYGSNFLKNIADYNVPTISNIQGNNFNPIVVAPVYSQASGGGGKIKFDTIKIELGGKIELTSGDKRRELDLSKLSAADMDRLAQAISKPVYTEIARRFEKGYNKETNPFRDA